MEDNKLFADKWEIRKAMEESIFVEDAVLQSGKVIEYVLSRISFLKKTCALRKVSCSELNFRGGYDYFDTDTVKKLQKICDSAIHTSFGDFYKTGGFSLEYKLSDNKGNIVDGGDLALGISYNRVITRSEFEIRCALQLKDNLDPLKAIEISNRV